MLDEATAAFDAETEKIFHRAIEALKLTDGDNACVSQMPSRNTLGNLLSSKATKNRPSGSPTRFSGFTMEMCVVAVLLIANWLRKTGPTLCYRSVIVINLRYTSNIKDLA